MRGIDIGVFSSQDVIPDINYHAFFDGTDDYMDGVTLPLANTSFTVYFKAKRNSGSSFDWALWSGTVGSDNNSLQIGWKSDHSFNMAFWINDLVVDPSYNDYLWHEWICTYDSVTKTQKVYMDGTEVGTRVSTSDYTGDGVSVVGRRYNSIYYARMYIDFMKVWDVYATPTDVSTGMNLNSGNLLAEWNFNNNGNDDSGNGRDLTENGGVTYVEE